VQREGVRGGRSVNFSSLLSLGGGGGIYYAVLGFFALALVTYILPHCITGPEKAKSGKRQLSLIINEKRAQLHVNVGTSLGT